MDGPFLIFYRHFLVYHSILKRVTLRSLVFLSVSYSSLPCISFLLVFNESFFLFSTNLKYRRSNLVAVEYQYFTSCTLEHLMMLCSESSDVHNVKYHYFTAIKLERRGFNGARTVFSWYSWDWWLETLKSMLLQLAYFLVSEKVLSDKNDWIFDDIGQTYAVVSSIF